MKMKNIDWSEPCEKFNEHFHYYCSVPPKAEIFSEKDFNDFCGLVDKCIEDDFDYTIKACGTIPPTSFELPKIIID